MTLVRSYVYIFCLRLRLKLESDLALGLIWSYAMDGYTNGTSKIEGSMTWAGMGWDGTWRFAFHAVAYEA